MELETIYKCFLHTIIINKPTSWFNKFSKHYPLLYTWIISKTPLLSVQDYNFHINTRVNWILNSITDFPKCHYCHEYIERWKHADIPVTHLYPKYCKAHAHCNDESRNKMRTTLANMPQEHWDNSLQKRKETCLSIYGYENVSQVPEILETITNSISAHFGVKRYSQLDCWKEQTIRSNNERYGVDWYPQSDEYQTRVVSTLQERYNENVVCAFQLSASVIKGNRARYKKYIYNNIVFDSQPEIAYYIWLTDNKIAFEYHPIFAKFKYTTPDNNIHTYCPDFYLIKEKTFIEIKGDQFFDKNGNYINPYDKEHPEFAKAKYECMIKNKVKILRPTDYNKYMTYINKTYGDWYLQKFKV